MTSCSSTYYLSTLKTTSPDIEQDNYGIFLIETDSIWLSYDFNGKDAPIHISIFNKTSKPLYIDWQRSSLILNGKAISYAGEKIEFSSITHSKGYSYESYDRRGSTVYENSREITQGEMNFPKTVSFIPPGSKVNESPIVLNVNFKEISKKSYRDFNIKDKDDNIIKVGRIDYNQENTPLLFRSYLTMNFEGGDPFVFEDEFYLSSLIKSKYLSPKKLPGSLNERGDLFYVKEKPNKTAANIIIGTALVAGAVAIDVWLEE